MKKGFTLLELIVVIIIVGILATLGFAQYTRMIEKGRTTEARSNLGVLRQRELAYYQENGAYAALGASDPLDTGLPGGATCANTHYFRYTCSGGNTDTCVATRCTSGGKTPQSTAGAYTITIDFSAGTFTDSIQF